jgi:polysaccharide biosynthesis protein PslG
LSVAVTKRLTRRANRFRVRSIVVDATRSLASSQSRGPALGTQFHCTQTQYNNAERVAVLDKLKAAGVSWVRIDVGWGGIEDSGKGARNGWYIGMVDFCVDEARKRGLNVLVMLWLTPRWANGGQAERVPPTNPGDYADFARWAAERWRGKVQAWEIWNETVLNAFWQGSEAQYAALLKAAYPAIKAGDPAAKVVFAGMSHNDDAYLRRLYALGVKGSFDVVATHPYQGLGDAPPEHPDDGNRWWLTHVPAVRKVMVENGDGGKPIWFTEFGWSAHANWPGIANWQRGVTPAQQADYAVRALRYTRAHYPYVGLMFWYKERASPLGTDVVQEGYGLLNADVSERPVYDALEMHLTTR